MAGNDIATDALRMALVLDIEGEAEALAKLQRINSVSETLNAKSRRAAEDLEMQRLAVEGKFNPDAQRELEFRRLIKLQEELNLSTSTYHKLSQQIDETWKDKTVRQGGFDVGQQDAHIRSYRELQQAVQEAADMEIATRQKVVDELQRIELNSLSARARAQREYDEAYAARLAQFNSGVTNRAEFQILRKDAERVYGERIAQIDLIEAKEKQAAARAREQRQIDKRLAGSDTNLPQHDLHIQEYRQQQQLEAEANKRRVADAQAAAKELQQIELDTLTVRERALREYHDAYNTARERLRAGTIDKPQFETFTDAAENSYEKRIAAIEEGEAKALEVRRRSIAADLKAMDDETASMQKEEQKRTDDIIEENQRRAKITIDAQLAQDSTRNARVQRAESIMRGFQTETQRAADAIQFFDNELRDGIITATQHAEAVENVNTRMRSMQRGAGNTAYVIGNLATGMEDFVTVISMTGFGMDGFAAATRSASNNIGQAVRGIGTAGAAIAAPMISIGAVLLGFAIPAVYKWVTGSEDAAKATEKWRLELEKLTRVAKVASTIELRNLDNDIALRDISKIYDTDSVDAKIQETSDTIKRKQIELQETIKTTAAQAQNLMNQLNPADMEQQFNEVADAIGRIYGDDSESYVRNTFKAINDEFKANAVLIGSDEALSIYETKIRKLVSELGTARSNMLADDQLAFDVMIGGLDRSIGSNAFVNPFFEWMNDAEIVDNIQAIREQVNALSKEQTEAAGKLRKELEDYARQLEALLDQRRIAEETERENHRLDMEDQLRSLEIQNKRNTLLGDENEAERKLLDLALRRQEIMRQGQGAMEAGLISPNDLEAMFDAELRALAGNLQSQLDDMTRVDFKAGTASQAEAYTSVARMTLEAAGKDNTKEKEMVDLLKAIRDHLANKNLIRVEVQ